MHINPPFSIGQVPAQYLIEQFGWPLYVYDAATIQTQYRRLQAAFSRFPHKIKYAVKANANINIIRLLKAEGAGLDAVSIQEVYLALHAGYAPHEILYTPNSVSFAEIQEAVGFGVAINIDNLPVLEQFGVHYGATVPVCIRINPHIWAGGHSHIQTGHIDSKFGISIHQMRHVLRIVKHYHLNVEGLHMHTGSDIRDPAQFIAGAEVLFDQAYEFPDLRYIDFGSGFKVPYRPGDMGTDVEALGEQLAARVEQFAATYGRSVEIWFEPGKYLVSNSGFLLTKVNTIKQTVSTIFAGIDTGLNHLIRPMFYDAYHAIHNTTNPDGTPRLYNVVGYVCETDTFAYDRMIPELREGDVIAIANAGAYGFSMSSNYNCRLRPAEILILDGQPHLIRKAETFEHLIADQIVVI
jgi:diaminopimelate decarboxylase